MGYVLKFTAVILFSLALLFTVGLMIGDANKSSPITSTINFKTLNQTQAFTSNLENQTKRLEDTVAASQGQTGELDALSLLNLAMQSGNTAIQTTIGMLFLGVALIFDASSILLLPAIFFIIIIVWVIFKFLAQIIEGWRTGRI